MAARPATAAAAVTVLLAACGSSPKEGLNDDTGPTPAASQGPIRVEMHDDTFTPESITAQVGSTLQIDLKNSGQRPHTFTSADLEIDRTLQPGDTELVTATARREGEFSFVCSFHEQQGMRGTIVVRR